MDKNVMHAQVVLRHVENGFHLLYGSGRSDEFAANSSVAESVDSLVRQVRAWGETHFPPSTNTEASPKLGVLMQAAENAMVGSAPGQPLVRVFADDYMELSRAKTKLLHLGYVYHAGEGGWMPPPKPAADVTVEGTFGWAIAAMKAGACVTRKGWNGKGMWLSIQRPDSRSMMTLPYIYMNTAQRDYVPWLASQTDMLADDWQHA